MTGEKKTEKAARPARINWNINMQQLRQSVMSIWF